MVTLKRGPDGAVEVLFADRGGHRHLIGLTYLREIGWYNVTLVDAAQVVGARGFLSFALLLAAALVALWVSVVLVLNRVVLDRVARLDRSVRAFSRGTRSNLPAGAGRDEVGRLEEGFRQMASSVREHTGQLEEQVAARTAELAEKNRRLEQALAEIRTLSDLLPTCMYCSKIRDQEGRWSRMEEYISQHTEAEFSHGICPDCLDRAYEEVDQLRPPEG